MSGQPLRLDEATAVFSQLGDFFIHSPTLGMIVIDQDLRMLGVNHAAARYLGKRGVDLVGLVLTDHLPEGWQPVGPRALQVGRAVFDEFPVSIGNETRWFALSAYPAELRGQRIAVIAFQDVTAWKAEEAPDFTSGHFNNVRKFLAEIAHDLKGPLTAIRATAQLATMSEPDRRPHLLERLLRQIDSLVDLLHQLLAVARPDQGEPVACDVAALCADVINLIRAEADLAGVRVDFQQEPVQDILARPHLLRRAFVNILINAIEATPRGGYAELRVSPSSDSEACIVTVKDSGRGIAPHELERVFSPFFTTKPGGTGLGLAITRQIIVETHGGRVDISSRPGAGTTVTLRLPLAKGVAEAV